MTTNTTGLRPSRWSVVLESADANALAAFYTRLLGWTVRREDDGWVTVEAPDSPAYLAFNTTPDYVRPVWPVEQGAQQMMLHLDFCVGTTQQELRTAVAQAESWGAIQAGFQPQDDVMVLLDPDGHPFCLYIE